MKITLVNANWLTQVRDWLATSLNVAGKLTTEKNESSNNASVNKATRYSLRSKKGDCYLPQKVTKVFPWLQHSCLTLQITIRCNHHYKVQTFQDIGQRKKLLHALRQSMIAHHRQIRLRLRWTNLTSVVLSWKWSSGHGRSLKRSVKLRAHRRINC